ncbi:MAG: hypothetical protein N2C14_14255 [Planctomycetales bacterium]
MEHERFLAEIAAHPNDDAPLRHHGEYTIHSPELRAVNFTAAPNAGLQLGAADATAASEMASVIQTDATKYCRSERATSVPKYGRFSAFSRTPGF